MGLGGLGEVAVHEAYRGRGFAAALCRQALGTFIERGGRALFLATSNPAAFRIYHRLGWRQFAHTHVMLKLTGGGSPEEFLVEYFAARKPVTVAEGTARDRMAMVPLIINPHDWHLLDANTQLLSTRYALQKSCMGLYPRYAALRADGRGTWFSANDADGRLVGLASVRLDDDRRALVDGFTHPRYAGCWTELLQAAMQWGLAHQAATCRARIAALDEEKMQDFVEIGFRPAGREGELVVVER